MSQKWSLNSHLQDSRKILDSKDDTIAADTKSHSQHLGDESCPGLSELDAAARLYEVPQADSGQGVETTADCTEGSTKYSGHKETRDSWVVTHHLHHEQGEDLVLLLHLPGGDGVTVMIECKDDQPSIGTDQKKTANAKNIQPNSPGKV